MSPFSGVTTALATTIALRHSGKFDSTSQVVAVVASIPGALAIISISLWGGIQVISLAMIATLGVFSFPQLYGAPEAR